MFLPGFRIYLLGIFSKSLRISDKLRVKNLILDGDNR